MAENKLSSTVKIDNVDFDVVAKIAEDAEKLGGVAATDYATKTFVNTNTQAKLISGTNIKTINGETILGSGDIKITGDYNETASKIEVTMDNDITANASITIKSSDPSGGSVGDIWFKY